VFWNEPNNGWISDGGLTFEQYRGIYEEVAQGVVKWLDAVPGRAQAADRRAGGGGLP